MDFSNDYFARTFATQKVMAILRGFDPERTVELCRIAWDAGIDAVEVPVQSESAYPSLAAAIDAARDRGKIIGAGTVIAAAQVERVAALGAAYTVAPGTSERVIQASAALDLPHLPGVASSSEITAVLEHGLTWVKAFPGAGGGPGWIAAHRGGPGPLVWLGAT